MTFARSAGSATDTSVDRPGVTLSQVSFEGRDRVDDLLRPFRDAEEREKVRNSLAAIGFGNTAVDQPVDQRPI